MPSTNRLAAGFAERQQSHRACLLPYITAGYPDVETTIELLQRLADSRIGGVELGIPYSDPIADGPVIQTSFYRALNSGFRLDRLFAALESARGSIAVPLIAMVSCSVVFKRGIVRFVEQAAAAGIEGLIVPELALEETAELAATARANHLSLVMIVAPTTPAPRQELIASMSSPFIYYQAVAGVTGERGALPTDLAARVAALRGLSGKPVCVGFGISTPEQVRATCAIADGAIVGSAIVRKMNEAVERGAGREPLVSELAQFIHELASAVRLG